MDKLKRVLALIGRPKVLLAAAGVYAVVVLVLCCWPGTLSAKQEEFRQADGGIRGILQQPVAAADPGNPAEAALRRHWPDAAVRAQPMPAWVFHFLPLIRKRGETEPPRLLSTEPAAGAVDWDVTRAEVRFLFSEPLAVIDFAPEVRVVNTTIGDPRVPFAAALEDGPGGAQSVVVVRLTGGLEHENAYQVTLTGEWRDQNHNRIGAETVVSFTTARKELAPEAGPVAPVPTVPGRVIRLEPPERVTVALTDAGALRVKWYPSLRTNATELAYQVLRREEGVDAPDAPRLLDLATRIPKAVTEFVDEGDVTPGRTYCYQVRVWSPEQCEPPAVFDAFENGFLSPLSAEACFTVPEKPWFEYRTKWTNTTLRGITRQQARVRVRSQAFSVGTARETVEMEIDVAETTEIGREVALKDASLDWSTKKRLQDAGVEKLDFRTGYKLLRVVDQVVPGPDGRPLKEEYIEYEDQEGRKFRLNRGQQSRDAIAIE